MCCDWSSSWKVIVSASPPQQKGAPSGEGWADAFLRLLNNREKARRGGFAVVVKAPQSLQTLQALCLQQSWNQCLTARYRLQGEPVFGTLLAAFLSDLSLWQNDKPFFRGDILPEYGRSDWGTWMATFVDEVAWTGPPSGQAVLAASAGAVEPELLERFLAAADRSLTTGRRLVLFGEVAAPTGEAEWEKGFEGLIGRLPERVGVVLSGPPPEFQLPVGDPRFLELEAGLDELGNGVLGPRVLVGRLGLVQDLIAPLQDAGGIEAPHDDVGPADRDVRHEHAVPGCSGEQRRDVQRAVGRP